MGHILDTKFVLLLLGTRDIYRVIATTSCKLQKVEQFQWEVTRTLKNAISRLSDMAEDLDIEEPENNHPEAENEIVDDAWSSLKQNIGDIRNGKFKNIAIGGGLERRHGRIRDYMGHQNDFTTAQNRLRSLAQAHSKVIKSRTLDNKDCPFPPILESMEKCLDLNILLKNYNKEDFEVESYGTEYLGKVLESSFENDKSKQLINEQY